MTQTERRSRAPGAPDRWPSDDPEAFAWALLHDVAPALRKYVAKLLPGDMHRTEDIVQEALLRAWQHREALTPMSSARPWLFRVAHNLTVDWYRRSGARPIEVSADGIDDLDLRAADQLENILRRRDVADALQDLSHQHREVLLYLYYFGLTQVEVAQALGIAQGTVKSRAHYALIETREVMRARGLMPEN